MILSISVKWHFSSAKSLLFLNENLLFLRPVVFWCCFTTENMGKNWTFFTLRYYAQSVDNADPFSQVPICASEAYVVLCGNYVGKQLAHLDICAEHLPRLSANRPPTLTHK